jgi:hypothetical protein
MQTYWQVVEPLFSVINFHDGPEAFANSIASIPRSSTLLFSAHMCLAEAHNGGFLQLFWNNTGVLVPEGIEGFITIGMPRMAEILDTAAALLGKPYPRDRDGRWDALLVASRHSELELEQIFKKDRDEPDKTKGLYIAFAEATKNLPFDELDRQFWETAKTENDGFQDAATRYAQNPYLIH